jgi:hypothetical protein
MFMKQFNHKNNHVFKPREYNQLKLLIMSFNVTTLALGLQPRQKGYKVASQ